MSIDAIIIQPAHVDFPLFRSYIKQYRDLFANVIVYISNSNRALNLTSFLKSDLSKHGVTVIDNAANWAGHDWRSTGTNLCLSKSTADRVLFLEQDVIFKDDNFLPAALSVDCDILGFKDDHERQGRLHPAFLVVSRSLINKTSCSFSASPPKYDHFGLFSEELEAQCEPKYIQDVVGSNWEHLAGLTHNYSLIMDGHSPCYMIDRFAEYNKMLLELDIDHSPEFIKIIESAARK